MKERFRTRRTVYEGRTFDVHVDDVALPNGADGVREVVEHAGAVVLVPVEADQVLLVRQYRYVVGQDLLELPAGTLELGEDARRAAARELAEETGRSARVLAPLVSLFPSPGYCTERMSFFVATDLEPARSEPDPDEFLELVSVPLDEAVGAAEAGAYRDMKTTVGLLLLRTLGPEALRTTGA